MVTATVAECPEAGISFNMMKTDEPKYGSYEYTVAMTQHEFKKKWGEDLGEEALDFAQDVDALWENGYIYHHKEHCTDHPEVSV